MTATIAGRAVRLDEWVYAATTAPDARAGDEVRDAVAICPSLALRLEGT